MLPATVSFVDIAGIVRGASEGEGLGNKFLANIREADAICQVIRAFHDDDVHHVEGKVSPKDDIETIHTEPDPRRPADPREGRAPPREGGQGQEDRQGRPRHRPGGPDGSGGGPHPVCRRRGCRGRHGARARAGLLTTKPFLYVFNVDEEQLTDEALQSELSAMVAPADAIFLNAKLESELAELDDEEARSCSSPSGSRSRA